MSTVHQASIEGGTKGRISGDPRPGCGLAESDFSAISVNGFGEPANSYVHSMAFYRGSVFAGTSRHSMALLKLFPPPHPPAMNPWPVTVPASVDELDMHGQIWRLDARHGSHSFQADWTKVYTSPDIASKQGGVAPRDLGYRGMTVFQGRSDRTPALYVCAISTVLRGCAARLLRTDDGETFETVGEPGLGNPEVSSLRAIVGFDGHLYVPPAGEGITFNSNQASLVMRSSDPAVGEWSSACEPGFGDPDNTGVFELAVFANHLYAGTFNARSGYQVWKTPATATAPNRWSKVLDQGAHRGPSNEIAMSMCVFDGALYVGSAIQNGGYDRVNGVGPAASDLIRIYPNDDWDVVVGQARQTPQGWKEPISGIGPGFGNPFAGYFWRMAAHRGWLYLSTFDWTIFLPFAGEPSTAARLAIETYGADEVVRRSAGFELWRSHDGRQWIPVTTTGFHNPYNYGGRTLVSTPNGLLVGTANPFAPTTPARLATGWQQVPNPRGGAEVWLGTSPNTAARRPPSSERTSRGCDVLLTGASGFIGSQLLTRLVRNGKRVRVLALPGSLDTHEHRGEIDVVHGSLDDADVLRQAVRQAEIVVHLAALLPGADPLDLHAVNVAGTAALLSACAAARPRRFVLMSSTAVYAQVLDPTTWPLDETSRVGPSGDGPATAYGWSKVAAEGLVARVSAEAGFEHVVLRSATCYGPGSPSTDQFIRSALNGPLNMESHRVLQYLHIDDVAQMVAALIDVAHDGDTLQLAGPDAMRWPAVQALVRSARGREVEPEALLSPVSRLSFPYDLNRIRDRGVTARISLREGLLTLADQARLGPSSHHDRPSFQNGW